MHHYSCKHISGTESLQQKEKPLASLNPTRPTLGCGYLLLFFVVVVVVDDIASFREVWEQRPMVLQRHNSDYNDGWFSTQQLDSILRQVN
jgi:hypothetical protein